MAGRGLAVEDSVLEGLGGNPAPRTEGGKVTVEPGGAGGQVTLTGSHRVNATR